MTSYTTVFTALNWNIIDEQTLSFPLDGNGSVTVSVTVSFFGGPAEMQAPDDGILAHLRVHVPAVEQPTAPVKVIDIPDDDAEEAEGANNADEASSDEDQAGGSTAGEEDGSTAGEEGDVVEELDDVFGGNFAIFDEPLPQEQEQEQEQEQVGGGWEYNAQLSQEVSGLRRSSRRRRNNRNN